MAEVKSLGIHTPVGLPYLILEELLHSDPKKELYQWETYAVQGENGQVDEEVLYTKDCVVLSQGKSVKECYRFDLEGEDVRQALLTRFSNSAKSKAKAKQELRQDGQDAVQGDESADEYSVPRVDSERALVVILKTKAHIYFLQGSHHIVDLPFETERAFPSPKGILLQRKFATQPSVGDLPSPKVPAPPQNSFFSSQLQPTASYQLSPTLNRSFAGSQPPRPSPLGAGAGGAGNGLSRLFDQVFGSLDREDDQDATALYSLTSPLAELGTVAETTHQYKPRISTNTESSSVAFESLDRSESLIYVSAEDELVDRRDGKSSPLMLLATVNSNTKQITIWHGWYIEEASLASLMKRRADHKAKKARRRSSFLSGSLAAGADTPLVRPREGGRESFAPGASLQLPSDVPPAHNTRSASRRRPTRQEDEEAMASQMDPEFQHIGSQQPARDNRRISSLVSRSDVAGPNTTTASFASKLGKRQPSFGPHNERRSFGARRSRGSTPGSVYGRSIGVDDDTMSMDLDYDASNGEHRVEAILKLVRSVYEVSSAESVFGSLDEGYRRELLVRRVHTLPLKSSQQSVVPIDLGTRLNIATLCERLPSSSTEDCKLGLYLVDHATNELTSLLMDVKDRPVWADQASPPRISIPIVVKETTTAQCKDIIKLRHGRSQAILLHPQGVLLSPLNISTISIPKTTPYRFSDPLEVLPGLRGPEKDVGRNRTMPAPEVAKLARAGAFGSFDEVAVDGTLHRRELGFSPSDSFVEDVLDACQLLLQDKVDCRLESVWCRAYARMATCPTYVSETAEDAEWVALTATILSPAITLVDEKTRASLLMRRGATSKDRSSASALDLQTPALLAQVCSGPVWAWLSRSDTSAATTAPKSKDQLLLLATTLAIELVLGAGEAPEFPQLAQVDTDAVSKLMLGLHILSEEQKLNIFTASRSRQLTPIIAQLGTWLGLAAWSAQPRRYLVSEADGVEHAVVHSSTVISVTLSIMDEPVGVHEWIEHSLKHGSAERYPSLTVVSQLHRGDAMSTALDRAAVRMTPRIATLSRIMEATQGMSVAAETFVEIAAEHGVDSEMLETLPIAIAAPFRQAIACCEKQPPTTWPSKLLRLVGRSDLDLASSVSRSSSMAATPHNVNPAPSRDLQSILHAFDHPAHPTLTREASRHTISSLLFHEDRRLVEATSLMHFNSIQLASCPKQPDWSDAFHLEQQQKVMQWVTARMIALPTGDGMLHFDSQAPLLTERYALPGFSSSCIMQPMGQTVTIDRSRLTEEKVNWAYFHAGVSSGLRISKGAEGIDTSWLMFNKPNDLTNRHAGLLLALGLNGHLRHLAKWLSFKYLTPKHTMTSVGLLLGISASWMGTMDSLVTRMLSVHITSMLPPGAAELNVSPMTQTAGLMGIGLLYYNTQHRRMSEIMLHEIEIMDVEDLDSGPDGLRDESYRLAAGLALGFINLAKGKDLRGLHGMRLPERLLNIAVGPRPVHAVHVFDKATAGAIVAIALVFMKSNDRAMARRIDVPDTEAQFDHVRPDMLMLRTMAKHLILWGDIEASGTTADQSSWIEANLPACYKHKLVSMHLPARSSLQSNDVPFYNIATGLAWALSLKYAGTGHVPARTEILALLDVFWSVRGTGEAYYYDGKLARSALRRCIDVLALAAATVMAGTGDLTTFRYLRRLHGKTDAETPYGSHLAAHMAIGILFLGGGTYTLGTSDLAVASVIAAFYPIFPTDVQDNRVHLQALRHFWVFAAEKRCIVVEDVDTGRPVAMPLLLTLQTGEEKMLRAPCLLPDLATVATLRSTDPGYWPITLDFASNPAHLESFLKNQTIPMRRCPAAEAHTGTFTTTLAALSTPPSTAPGGPQLWDWIFNLPLLRDQVDKADVELILPNDPRSSVALDGKGTVVDARLALRKAVERGGEDELWGLRVLFAWAEKHRDTELAWLGRELVDELKGKIEDRRRSTPAK
ncbi:Anaphase-promoting complex subunit 1 [Oleoguttula sp. CCFEE 5521]